MTIGKKISLACVALVAWTVILGTVSILNLNSIDTKVVSIVEGPLPGLHALLGMVGDRKQQRIDMLQHILSDNADQKSQLEASIADLERHYDAESRIFEKSVQTAQGREQFERLAPINDRVTSVWARVLPLSRAMSQKEAMAIWNSEAVQTGAERNKLFDEISDQKSELAAADGKAAIASGESAMFWAILILVVSLVSGALLAFFIVRGIQNVLTNAVAQLGEGAEQVASASGQVSGSSQSLAQGASEQAASLEETSASSEEMSSMTRKNADNSQQAAALMNAVSQRVAEANLTLADMTTSMQEIGASSGKISKIIKVIDEIAFQTNILALNAAVEAARAGEAGMGFAVVADEVRNLAQRSAQAAKDTTALIEDSILKSSEGSQKLGQVASSIEAITEGAGKAKILVDEVEASSQEQAQGISQIAKAVAQMDQVTQRTAASAEESASASEELSAQSQALMAVVEQLQTLVGGATVSGTGTRRAVAARVQSEHPARTKPTLAKLDTNRPGQIRRLETAPGHKPTLAFSGANPRRAAEFPLDDSEFKEF